MTAPGRAMELRALQGFPDVRPGMDLPDMIIRSLYENDLPPRDGDALVVAQKVVSKAEGRIVPLRTVSPGGAAVRLAEETGKDARLVELILRESRAVSRRRRGLVIGEHRLGFIAANAGIDASNVEGTEEVVCLLPEDPDASARAIREALRAAFDARVGVVVSDTHGRPHRAGAVGVAIGVAGLAPLRNYVGQVDRYGYHLRHTLEAVADELASAAGLVQGQADEGLPVILIRGAPVPSGEGSARDLVRPADEDLYR